METHKQLPAAAQKRGLHRSQHRSGDSTMNRRLFGFALLAALVLGTMVGGCATNTTATTTTTTPAQQAERAERFVAIAQNTAIAFRDAQVQLRDRAISEGDARTADKARSAIVRVNKVLPYFDTAQAGLKAARGDMAAQSRVLADMVSHFSSDPELALLVARSPPLITELNEAAAGQPTAHR